MNDPDKSSHSSKIAPDSRDKITLSYNSTSTMNKILSVDDNNKL